MPGATWRETAERLRREIVEGGLGAEGPLPGQFRLAAALGASRHAVRRALAALEQEGLVVSRQGRAAERAPSRLVYRIGPTTRFGLNAETAGRTFENRVLAVRRRRRPVRIARMLGVAPAGSMVTITQLRLLDGAPFCLGVHYFDPLRLPGIADALCRGEGVTAALRACGCAVCRREATLVEARRPTAFEAVSLDAPPTLPVLFTLGRNVDADGRPIEITETVFRSDRASLMI